MAKKIIKSSPPVASVKAPTDGPTSTPVRNTTVPPKSVVVTAPAKKPVPTREEIALRAYFLWQSNGGSEFENWIRAERELLTV